MRPEQSLMVPMAKSLLPLALVVLLILSFEANARGRVSTGAHPWDRYYTSKYKDFMPYGFQALFAGTYQWKFPPDFQMLMGQVHDYPLPQVVLDNTNKG